MPVRLRLRTLSSKHSRPASSGGGETDAAQWLGPYDLIPPVKKNPAEPPASRPSGGAGTEKRPKCRGSPRVAIVERTITRSVEVIETQRGSQTKSSAKRRKYW